MRIIRKEKQSKNEQISISIITATYNADLCLENLITSIIPQLTARVEFIIIDGGSTDNTIKIIKKYEHYISYWISESDQGIYDAWNKGLKKASGNWIMFLGADDQLMPHAIEIYSNFINDSTKDLDIISSKLNYVNGNYTSIKYVGEPWDWNKFRLGKMSFAHPGMLHSKNLFIKNGYFDITFKICGDLEFLLRTKGNINAGFIDLVTVIMQKGGVSYTLKAIIEAFQIRKRTQSISDLNNYYIFSKVLMMFYLSRFKQAILSRFKR